MADSQFTCNCDVIHEDIVNDVKKKMQSKEEYIELASLFKIIWGWYQGADSSCIRTKRDVRL